MVKIIATLGPSSEKGKIISELIDHGVDVFRFNFSHADYEKFRKLSKTIKKLSKQKNKNIELLADTKGPEIRTGSLSKEYIEIKKGHEIMFTNKEILGNNETITINYPYLMELEKGTIIKIDDGKYSFIIKEVKDNYLLCYALNHSKIKPRKSVSIKGHDYKLESVSKKDMEDIKFAVENGFNIIALSFSRHMKDIEYIKRRIPENIKIISKIEDWKGYKNLGNLISVSDGIMVARGDLGVETGIEKIGIMQKKIIRETKKQNKEVIVATHMLESMIYERIPTRAEISDVTNAVLDGSDYLMLSGETAIGKDPVNVVKVMKKIIDYVEKEKVV